MKKEVIVWLGNETILNEDETINDLVQQITDGSILFMGGPDKLRITTKGGRVLYDKPY